MRNDTTTTVLVRPVDVFGVDEKNRTQSSAIIRYARIAIRFWSLEEKKSPIKGILIFCLTPYTNISFESAVRSTSILKHGNHTSFVERNHATLGYARLVKYYTRIVRVYYIIRCRTRETALRRNDLYRYRSYSCKLTVYVTLYNRWDDRLSRLNVKA